MLSTLAAVLLIIGLGGLLLFPMSVGASAVLLEKASQELLLAALSSKGLPLSLNIS